MIKESGITNDVDWNEKVQIELSVADLQIIYDCVGAVPIKYLNLKHKNDMFATKYDATIFNSLYNELDDILFRHNGLTDEGLSADAFVELNIVEE